MTRMIRGSVLLAACVGLWSCSSDPTADEAGVPFKIVSLPSVVFVKQDSSQLISFQLVDELDGQIPETWTFTSSSPNFTVAMDSSYRPVYNSDGTLTLPEVQTEVRATITGTALGISNFTASAGGKTLVIPVNVVPGNLYATFSPANPNPGDTVTMTMPPTLRLSPTSAVTFPGNVNPIIIDRAADSLSLRFISAPTTDTTAVVTLVSNTEFPTIAPVTLTTKDKVTGSQSGTWTGQLPATLSPLVAGQVTVTLNPAYAFKCNPTCGNTLPSVFTFPTQTAPIVSSVSADSTVAVLSVGPNVASPLQVTRVTFKGAPQFEYTLTTGTDSVISPVVANFPATLSNYTPQIGEPIVLTAGAGFTFSATAVPTWPNGGAAIVSSRTATTLTVQPWPGSSGSPTAVTGVIAASAPAFQITIPAVLPTPLAMQATAAAIPPIAGTDAFATAPVLSVGNVGVFDAASFGCIGCGVNGFDSQIYSLTVPAGSRTFTLIWSNNSDLGLYFQTVAGGGPVVTTGCDAHGNGATAQPETCTATFPAGTYFLNVENFAPAYPDPDPTWIALRFN